MVSLTEEWQRFARDVAQKTADARVGRLRKEIEAFALGAGRRHGELRMKVERQGEEIAVLRDEIETPRRALPPRLTSHDDAA